MEDDSAWVFDSLICFLNGPEWNAPLQSFIEEKSLIFETHANDNEEHSKVYDEFKNLVDFMLGNFMEDLGITPKQFEDACNRQNTEKIPIPFDQNLFELIWAANDYVMFKKMMSQKNIELQLEALELIERKYGKTPQSFVADQNNDDKVNGPETLSRKINKTPDIEDKIKEEVAKTFPEPEEKEEEVEFIQEEKKMLENTLKEMGKEKYEGNHAEKRDENVLEITKTGAIPKSFVQNETKEQPRPGVPYKREILDRPPLNAEVNEIELKKRQEYLRAQRDKLVALKKDIRKKHLTVDQNVKQNATKRPKSAKAAEALLTGNKTNIEPQQLELRKTLIERLKTEVIQQKND